MEKMINRRGFKVPAYTVDCLPDDLAVIDSLIDAYESALANGGATYKLAAMLAEYGVSL